MASTQPGNAFRCSLALLPAFTLLTLFAAYSFPHDPDLGYHLVIGDTVLENLSFPNQDVFRIDSHAEEIAYSWLPDITLSMALTWGGLLGLRLWVISGIFVLSLLMANFFNNKSSPLRNALVLAVASFCLMQLCMPRPKLIGTLCFAWLLTILQSEYSTQAYRKRCLSIFSCVVLWANCHISVCLAPFVVGLCGACNWLQGQSDYRFRQVVSYVMLAASAVLVNPYGFSLYAIGLEFSPSGHQALSNQIVELISFPELQSPYPVWAYGAICLAVLWTLVTLARVGQQGFKACPNGMLGSIMLTLVFSFLAWNTARHTSFFAVAAVFSLSLGMPNPRNIPKNGAVFGVVLFMSATLVGLNRAAWTEAWYDEVSTSGMYPAIALEGVLPLLEQEKRQGGRWNILTSFGRGHFTTWWLHRHGLLPQAGVLLDGRIDSLGKQRFFPIQDAFRGECPQETLEFYNADIVIADKTDKLFEYLDDNPDWILVSGGFSGAFVRRSTLTTYFGAWDGSAYFVNGH